jgi:hypothetical protein
VLAGTMLPGTDTFKTPQLLFNMSVQRSSCVRVG